MGASLRVSVSGSLFPGGPLGGSPLPGLAKHRASLLSTGDAFSGKRCPDSEHRVETLSSPHEPRERALSAHSSLEGPPRFPLFSTGKEAQNRGGVQRRCQSLYEVQACDECK